MENSVDVPQKLKNKVVIWSNDPTPGHVSGENYNSKRYTLPCVHSSTVHSGQEMETTYMSINGWVDKEDVHIHNRVLLSHKKNEIMPFAAAWKNLEMITLSEVRQRKANTIWYHLYVESKIGHKWIYSWNKNRLTDMENRLVIAKGDGLGGWIGSLRLIDTNYCIENR